MVLPLNKLNDPSALSGTQAIKLHNRVPLGHYLYNKSFGKFSCDTLISLKDLNILVMHTTAFLCGCSTTRLRLPIKGFGGSV